MHKKKATLFWRIQHPVSGKIAFLLGIRETISPDALPLFEKKLRSRSDCASWFIQTLAPFPGELPPGLTLDQCFSSRHFARLTAIFRKAFQTDIQAHNRQYPLAVRDSLASRIMEENGHQNTAAVVRENLPAGSAVLQPLDPDYADRFYASIPLDFQLRQLRLLGKNPARFRQKINKKIGEMLLEDPVLIWRKTRVKLTGAERKSFLAYNTILTGRIQELTTPSPAFFLIEASRLGGGKGVLRGLKRAGWVVSGVREG